MTSGTPPRTPQHHATLAATREAASTCRNCDLWRRATQTVFGEGPERAPIVLVGEQPGDQEDLAGRPFVGPSGRLLRAALTEAGLDPMNAYVTNAVKHFKWQPRGKRRLHLKPSQMEVNACRPWLEAELALVRPRVVVCLGATAAHALLGRDVRVTALRGTVVPSRLGMRVFVTVHPSSVLRASTPAQRREELRHFTADMVKVAELLHGQSEPVGRAP